MALIPIQDKLSAINFNGPSLLYKGQQSTLRGAQAYTETFSLSLSQFFYKAFA